ncbi:DUF2909 domain-containing protein [Thaumasiovibrio subtropicus]|uniref:DUF2909 domain-containing protein n=1 Tax=Thaumasiovibrio subtropicus TaxID=1891207 RepID=UPI000B3628B8|nr:DUF2909 domain-containing protein [Thaumasiovibrio subtropicus]
MWIKALLIILLVFVILNLFRALPALLKGKQAQPLSHFLGKRLIFSVLIFALLLVAMATGMITPNPRPY